MKDNQIAIKEVVKRPIRFKSPLKDEGAPNKLDAFDFMEKKDVEGLIPFIASEDMMTDMGVLAYDLNQLINKVKLSKREHEIIELFREGFKSKEVQDELGIKKQNLKRILEE